MALKLNPFQRNMVFRLLPISWVLPPERYFIFRIPNVSMRTVAFQENFPYRYSGRCPKTVPYENRIDRLPPPRTETRVRAIFIQ